MHLDTTGHFGPEAIVAFIDGTASPEVASHVQGCAVCSSEANDMRATQDQLRAALYRFDCPTAHQLGEYELGYVAQDERVRIASHALECSLCTEDLKTLRSFMAVEPVIREGFVSQVRRVLATLVTPLPSTSLSGIRGGAETRLRQFQAGDTRVSLSHDGESLTGLLVPAATGQARLLADRGAARTTDVDELGNFDFEDVSAGAYTLEIELADEIIVVEQLSLD